MSSLGQDKAITTCECGGVCVYISCLANHLLGEGRNLRYLSLIWHTISYYLATLSKRRKSLLYYIYYLLSCNFNNSPCLIKCYLHHFPIWQLRRETWSYSYSKLLNKSLHLHTYKINFISLLFTNNRFGSYYMFIFKIKFSSLFSFPYVILIYLFGLFHCKHLSTTLPFHFALHVQFISDYFCNGLELVILSLPDSLDYILP